MKNLMLTFMRWKPLDFISSLFTRYVFNSYIGMCSYYTTIFGDHEIYYYPFLQVIPYSFCFVFLIFCPLHMTLLLSKRQVNLQWINSNTKSQVQSQQKKICTFLVTPGVSEAERGDEVLTEEIRRQWGRKRGLQQAPVRISEEERATGQGESETKRTRSHDYHTSCRPGICGVLRYQLLLHLLLFHFPGPWWRPLRHTRPCL